MNFLETTTKVEESLTEVLRQFQWRLLRLENQKIQAVQFQRVHDDAILPKYAHAGDSGMDVFWTGAILSRETQYKKTDYTSSYQLKSEEHACFYIGWKVQVPEGYELQIRPKSGLALHDGLTILNTPGTIDSSYRGEIGVILMNLGSKSVPIQKGQKIAQFVLCPVIKADVQEVESLDETSRNDGGFGSTGK